MVTADPNYLGLGDGIRVEAEVEKPEWPDSYLSWGFWPETPPPSPPLEVGKDAALAPRGLTQSQKPFEQFFRHNMARYFAAQFGVKPTGKPARFITLICIAKQQRWLGHNFLKILCDRHYA